MVEKGFLDTFKLFLRNSFFSNNNIQNENIYNYEIENEVGHV